MRSKAVSNERGAILLESAISFAVIVPILSGMLLVGQLYQERALLSQALRSSTRPAAFFRSIGISSEEVEGVEQPTELDEVYKSICDLLDLSINAARLTPSDYELSLELRSLEALMENRIENPETSSRFLVVKAKRKAGAQIPFYGEVGKNFEMKALFPISLDETQVIDETNNAEFDLSEIHICDTERSVPA